MEELKSLRFSSLLTNEGFLLYTIFKMRKNLLYLFILACIGNFIFSSLLASSLPPEVIARVNGEDVPLKEFLKEIRGYMVLGQLEGAVEKSLEEVIRRHLLVQEAKRRKLHLTKTFKNLSFLNPGERREDIMIELLKKEIRNQIEVTDEEIEELLQERMKNIGQISMEKEEVWEALKEELLRRKMEKAMDNLVEELKKKAQIELNEEVLQQWRDKLYKSNASEE